MFKKLKRKIFLTLFVIPAIFVLSLSALLISSICLLYSRDFHSNIDTNVRLTIESVKFQLELLSSEELSFANDVAGLSSYSLAERLNQIAASSELILGAVYYIGTDIFSTPTLGGVKTLNEVCKDTATADFLASEAVSGYVIRAEGIPGNYGFVPCDPERGMLSFIVKIGPEALLVADLDSEALYQQLLSFDDYQYFENSISFLINDHKTALKRNEEIPDNIVWNATEKLTKYNTTYQLLKPLNENGDLALLVSIPRTNLERIYWLTVIPVLGVDFVLLLGLLVLSDWISRRKTDELDKLRRSMREDISELPTL